MKNQISLFCVIGSGKLVDELIKNLLETSFTKDQFLGKVEIPPSFTKKQLRSLIKKSPAIKASNLVYIYADRIDSILCNDLLSQLDYEGKNIKMIMDLDSAMAKRGKIEYVDYIPVLNLKTDPVNDIGFKRKKRVFDVLFSIMAILLLFPLIILVSIITFLSSKGPVLYKQERLGREGKSFKMYKFRSMYVNAETTGPALTMKNDPRVTPWGRFMRRFKLDELPQFYNSLMGSMSVVGPRPEREFWKHEIEKEAFQFRKLTSIKPGITSLGQVKFGYAVNVQEMRKRLRYDLLYLNNLSIKMDIKIILMTMGVILRGYKKK
jgi:lipopolysaccharide/colanic/teichoic acid biosynthesis glycosyltransferase